MHAVLRSAALLAWLDASWCTECEWHEMCGSAAGDCCANLDADHQFVNALAEREGPAEILMPLVATGRPVLTLATDVSSMPDLNVEVTGAEPLIVTVSLQLRRIKSMDEKAQTFDMLYAISTFWRDCRIQTNCTLLSLSEQSPYYQYFWRPRISMEERIADLSEMRAFRHDLGPWGWHSFTEEHVSTFACTYDFRKMPFDSHRCKLTFVISDESNFFRPLARLRWNNRGPIGNRLRMTGWVVTQPEDWTITEAWRLYQGPFSTINMSILTAEFTIQRDSPSMIDTFVIPSILCYVVSLLGLWIDIKAVPARTFAACVPVMIQSSRITALTSVMPPISYKTRLNNFMQFSLMMTVAHVAEFVIVHVLFVRAAAAKEEGKERETTTPATVPPVPLQDDEDDYFTADEPAPPPKVIDVDDEPAPSQPIFEEARRLERLCISLASKHLERHMRWMSPVVYTVSTLGVLYGAFDTE